jgi:hypothetical protein
MDVASSGQALVKGDSTSLIDVLSIPTVCQVVLSHFYKVSALRLTCRAICALVGVLHGELESLLGLEQTYIYIPLACRWINTKRFSTCMSRDRSTW